MPEERQPGRPDAPRGLRIVAGCLVHLAVAAAAAGVARAAVRFVDATAQSGITFVHDAARTPERQLPETMGGGVLLFDLERDGDLDVLLVQSGAVVAAPGTARPPHEVWRQLPGMRFELAARLPNDGVGMGACAGDVDGDGDDDVVVTSVGDDVLLVNDGGILVPTTRLPGDGRWTTSCTFADLDSDGDLDVHAAGYVRIDPSRPPLCGDARAGRRSYCHPSEYAAAQDATWLNDGAGRFTRGEDACGMARSDRGKGLGVIAWDPDEDGDLDLLVANDATPNDLWLNDGSGRMREIGLAAGVACDAHGRFEAGMGIAAADFTGDGRLDAVITNLDDEGNALLVAQPGAAGPGAALRFTDASEPLGLHELSVPFLGFGIEAFDADLDGDQDLLVANGHVLDDVAQARPRRTHAQRLQLLLNDGTGRFTDCGDCGLERVAPVVGRGLATGDLDGDGDLDAVVATNGGPPVVLRNVSDPQPVLVLELRARRTHHQAQGASVRVLAADAATVVARGWVAGARSYLSQGTRRLHLACERAGSWVEVRWPGGAVETWRNLAPGQYALVEGRSGEACPRLAVIEME